MSLVPLATGKKHLEVDHDADDDIIQLYLNSSELRAMEFLQRKVYATQEDLDEAVKNNTAGDRPMLINDIIVHGVLVYLGDAYANREGVSDHVAENILIPYRINQGI